MQSPETPTPPGAPSCRGRVLIVDDEPIIGTMLQRMLRDEHEVVAMTDPREALCALERLETGSFDVIIVDVMMPHMTGIELLEAMRAKHPTLAEKVVFMTGGGTTPASREFLRTTSNVVLEKPINMKELRARIRAQVLRQGEGAAH